MRFLKLKLTYIIVVFLFVVTAVMLNCSSYNLSSDGKKSPTLIYGNGEVYKDDWRKVDSLEQNGLNKTALETVEEIFAKAKKEENHQQIIKSLIVKAKFQSRIEENAFVKTIHELEQEVRVSNYPLTPILHSIVAELYWNYYEMNRWKFYNRTSAINFDNQDIATWDLKKITETTVKHYLLSLKNIDSLKRTPIEPFKEIIEVGDHVFRPTLYDFLAHRAIDYFINEEPNVTRPVYEFVLDTTVYLAPGPEFCNVKITSKDTMSLKYYALQILQELTRIHLNDADPTAFIDVELKRLKFVKNNTTLNDKDTLFYKALSRLYTDHIEHSTTAEIIYEIARVHYEKGSSYDPINQKAGKWELKKARNMCLNGIKRYPETYGADKCRELEKSILSIDLNVRLEKVNTPNIPIKGNLTFRNVDTLHFKLQRVDFDKYKKWSGLDRKKRIENLLSSDLVKQWTFNTKNDGDHQKHTGEFKMHDGLKMGFYILLASTTTDFGDTSEAVTLVPFWVSNLSLLSRKDERENIEFFVLDREKGSPLKEVKAKLYYEKYNYASRKYEWKSLGERLTDKDGYFKVAPSSEYSNFYADLYFGEDRLNTENNFYHYQRNREAKSYTRTVFFTDRAIYRPGQTVHFKGIMLRTNNYNDNQILVDQPTTVTFYDVNHQKVATQKFTTNEFGTFSGSFIAPNNGLNGQMYISDQHGSKYISVEEYKRPKFEVKFNPIEGSYKLGEQVNTIGKATAYSGAPLDEAMVKYRVVRNATFSYTCFYRWGYWPSSPQVEIVNGSTKTNQNGEFNVDFVAQPDLTIGEELAPTYSYTVYADVTDINGETHSASAYVHVAYHAINVAVRIPEKINKNGVDTFRLETTNLNGQHEPTKGTIKIWKLQSPATYYRNSLWDKGDLKYISKEEYKKDFPYDTYEDENNQYKWEKEVKVYDAVFNTGLKKSLRFDKFKNWKSGSYKLVALAQDKFGEKVEEIHYFTIYDDLEKTLPINELDWFVPIKTIGEPGENAEFLIGSAAEEVKLWYEVEHKGAITERNWMTINHEQKKVMIPILEKHRGNFQVHFTFVRHGRNFTHTVGVNVPHTNKQLDIKFETFRNKLLPGQNEEWRIKIKGKKGEKVAAEMVAALYDASLDAFRSNYWGLDVLYYDYSSKYWENNRSFSYMDSEWIIRNNYDTWSSSKTKIYDRLNWFGYIHQNYYHDYGYDYNYKNMEGQMYFDADMTPADVMTLDKKSRETLRPGSGSPVKMKAPAPPPKLDAVPVTTVAGKKEVTNKATINGLDVVKARKNFSETAFFYPHLATNNKGEVIIKFEIPESLTKWKFMGLAHTKDLKTGMIYEEAITQKDLMVYPNAPRFFREQDNMDFVTKITNLSEKNIQGAATVYFYDALTMQDISSELTKGDRNKDFQIKNGKSSSISWNITLPKGYSAITYKVLAKAGNFEDGEEMAVPVLTNRMLVTESLPLPIRGKQSKDFKFEKLMGNTSNTLRHHKLTLEYTSNPAWYAIQALPYLMDYPYECAEQIFSRFYANSIASHIANSNPKVSAIFESWKNTDSKEFLSNLEKNQELKSLLLEETPWVLDAQNESERKKRVGLLFDLNRMSNELGRAEKKLQQMQVSNGGWPWFKGMPESRYITQHIVTGMGHLDHLGIKEVRNNRLTWNMLRTAVYYLDSRIKEDYEWLKKHVADLKEDHISREQIQYLYARSYFLDDMPIEGRNKEAYTYFLNQAKTYWLKKGIYMQGMIALALQRGIEKNQSGIKNKIIASLKNNAIQQEEMGMYWKSNSFGYSWYQAPIEVQALLIEAFHDIENDIESVEAMKVWLLKQKQTQDWRTTKATAEACYAMLLRGTDLLASDELVQIKVGSLDVNPKKIEGVKPEAGTGYFKTSWSGNEIKSGMGNISVSKKDDGVAWGAMYWQYFEELDKIKPHNTPLKLKKQLFLERNSDAGPVITPIVEGTSVGIGDKIKVRIELRVDRNMDYVHMKDMRAAGFEPLNVFSGYRYQDGLGYYESTKDAATNFFFDRLTKGTYVFEYSLRVNMSGDFSNGVTSIQCMYAPEFASHSEGVRVKVKSK